MCVLSSLVGRDKDKWGGKRAPFEESRGYLAIENQAQLLGKELLFKNPIAYGRSLAGCHMPSVFFIPFHLPSSLPNIIFILQVRKLSLRLRHALKESSER